MKLYTGPISLFSAKVRIAVVEKSLDVEEVSVGWTPEHRYEPHHPEVVALNPRRTVPVLVDGQTVVCDSTVILEYLEEIHPEPRLYPTTAAGRARARGFETCADQAIFPAIWELIEEVFYPAPPEGRDASRAEAARARLASLHRELDEALAGREFLCDEFGVGDIACFVMLSAGLTLGSVPEPGLENLSGWLGRCGARPAVRDEVASMQAFVASLSPPA
jgi:glutathione S-transferase